MLSHGACEIRLCALDVVSRDSRSTLKIDKIRWTDAPSLECNGYLHTLLLCIKCAPNGWSTGWQKPTQPSGSRSHSMARRQATRVPSLQPSGAALVGGYPLLRICQERHRLVMHEVFMITFESVSAFRACRLDRFVQSTSRQSKFGNHHAPSLLSNAFHHKQA